MIISSRIIKKIKINGSWPVLVIIIFIISFSACTNVLRPTIKKENIKLKNERFIVLKPLYTYNETLDHEPHEKRYWIFAKDSLKYYQMATDALNERLLKSKGRLNEISNADEMKFIDSIFKLLRQQSQEKVPFLFNINNYSDSIYVLLKIHFDMDKGLSGVSGLGSANEGIAVGDYYADIAIVKNRNIIYFKSIRRNFSPARRLFSIERSRNLIESLFKDVW